VSFEHFDPVLDMAEKRESEIPELMCNKLVETLPPLFAQAGRYKDDHPVVRQLRGQAWTALKEALDKHGAVSFSLSEKGSLRLEDVPIRTTQAEPLLSHFKKELKLLRFEPMLTKSEFEKFVSLVSKSDNDIEEMGGFYKAVKTSGTYSIVVEAKEGVAEDFEIGTQTIVVDEAPADAEAPAPAPSQLDQGPGMNTTVLTVSDMIRLEISTNFGGIEREDELLDFVDSTIKREVKRAVETQTDKVMRQLRRAYEDMDKLEAILANTPYGIAITDHSGNVVLSANEALVAGLQSGHPLPDYLMDAFKEHGTDNNMDFGHFKVVHVLKGEGDKIDGVLFVAGGG
jgi:hypothetical protein